MTRLAAGLAAALALAVAPVGAQQAPAASPDPVDVATLDALVDALYTTVSGPAGDRDWDRFHSLFLPGATLLNAGPRPDTARPPEPVSPAGYRERSAPYFAEHAFFESEIARTTHRYGTVAQIWSTYVVRQGPDEAPSARGINSIVAVRHAGRWWIVSVVWDAEKPGQPIPEAYLPGG